MALATPGLIVAESGQNLTHTVTLTTYQSIAGWTVSAILRSNNGGSTLATGTATPTDTGLVASWSIAWSAAGLTLEPGGYEWTFLRTNSGSAYPIVEPSGFVITANGAGAYPTLTNLVEYVAHALPDSTLSTSQNKQITMLLAAAESRVKSYCGRDFVYRATHVEYYDGTGATSLRLRRTPIVCSSVAIRVDRGGNYGQTADSFATATALTLGEDYAIAPDSLYGDALNHSGLVERLGTIWPYRIRRQIRYLSQQIETLPGCIKATYTGGFQLIPFDLKLAVWDIATMYRIGSTWGQIANSESGEGYSRSLGSGQTATDLPIHVKAILDHYRDGASIVG